MTKYTAEQVLQAARAAYYSSASGNNENYVEDKANAFVNRCLHYDDVPAGSMISQYAVKNIAFAALDPYCTAQLYSVLDGFVNEEQSW